MQRVGIVIAFLILLITKTVVTRSIAAVILTQG